MILLTKVSFGNNQFTNNNRGTVAYSASTNHLEGDCYVMWVESIIRFRLFFAVSKAIWTEKIVLEWKDSGYVPLISFDLNYL